MEQLVMEKVFEEMGCKTEYDKMMCSELVYLVLAEPSNKTGCDSMNKQEELRKWIYGDKLGTSEEKVLHITGYWSNDLADVFGESVGINGKNVFPKVFDAVKDKEAISGVVFH